MLLRIHVDAISAFKDIKNHIEMQRLFSLCLLIHLKDALFFQKKCVCEGWMYNSGHKPGI